VIASAEDRLKAREERDERQDEDPVSEQDAKQRATLADSLFAKRG
jgi:hypothetical protein